MVSRDAEVQFRTKARTELFGTGPKVQFKVRIFAEPDLKSSSRFSKIKVVRTWFEPKTLEMPKIPKMPKTQRHDVFDSQGTSSRKDDLHLWKDINHLSDSRESSIFVKLF